MIGYVDDKVLNMLEGDFGFVKRNRKEKKVNDIVVGIL